MATKLHYDMYEQSCDETRMEILNEKTYAVDNPLQAIVKACENPGCEFVCKDENDKNIGIIKDFEGLRKETLTDPDRKAKENVGEAERAIEQNHNQREVNSHSRF